MAKIFCVILILISSFAAFSADLKVSKYPKVLTGENSVIVTIVDIVDDKGNATGKALVKVEGDVGEWDGKVFLDQYEKSGRNEYYKYKDSEKGAGEYNRIIAQQSAYGDGKTYELFTPTKPMDGIKLHKDEKKSTEMKDHGKDILAEYNKKPAKK